MTTLYAGVRAIGCRACMFFVTNGKTLVYEVDCKVRMSSQCITSLTREIMKPVMDERNRHEGSRVMKRENLQQYVNLYKNSSDDQKKSVLLFLGKNYGSNQEAISSQCASISELFESERESPTLLSAQQRLSQLLKPVYHTLFTQIGTVNNGVKFLVDLRHDALQSIKGSDLPRTDLQNLKHLSGHVGDILSMWFSVGLLQLQRITWGTSAEILEKLAMYEAVHAVKNWMDLKHRLGQNRRCYAFFHTSMPSEPLIVLHVALTKAISDNITGILDYRSERQNVTSPECAIFYSITSTQKGLQGIELGAYLIQSVVNSLKQELPQLTTFSSLSPIPGFRKWLMHMLKEDTVLHLLGPEETSLLVQAKDCAKFDGDIVSFLKVVTQNLEHFRNSDITSAIRAPLLQLCAIYLSKIKRRGYALDPVANFHLKNGAVVWRVNWMADKSPSGMQQSFGLMVNYRYFLEDMAKNSSNYITNQAIRTSALVDDLLYAAKSHL